MTDDVRLPKDVIEKCKDWADEVVAHYTSGDPMQTLPWNRDLLTPDEFKAWVATRKDAGAKIDIETCEIGAWKALDLDPYGEGGLPEEFQQIGTNRYVRSPESRGWVHTEDLPSDKVEAMYARIEENARWQAEHPPHVDALSDERLTVGGIRARDARSLKKEANQ